MEKETLTVTAFFVIILVANMFIIAVSGLVIKEHISEQYSKGYQSGVENALKFQCPGNQERGE